MQFFLAATVLAGSTFATPVANEFANAFAGSKVPFPVLGQVYKQVDLHFNNLYPIGRSTGASALWSESDLQTAIDMIEGQYDCEALEDSSKLQNKCLAQKAKAIVRAIATDSKNKQKFDNANAKAAAKAAKEAAKEAAKVAKEEAKAIITAAKAAAKEAAAAAKDLAKAERDEAKAIAKEAMEAAKKAAKEIKEAAKEAMEAAKVAAKEAKVAAIAAAKEEREAAKEAAQEAKEAVKDQKATNKYKVNDSDYCVKGGATWTNDGHVDDWTLANGASVQSYDGVISITKPEDQSSNAAGYVLIEEISGANVVEVHFDSFETDMLSVQSFNQLTGVSNWCDVDAEPVGSGDNAEEEALVMVSNGEITVEAGSNPESFTYYYCYDPTAVQDC